MIAKTKKKRKFNSEIFFQILFFILILFFIGFLVVSNLKINKKRTELIDKIESLKKEIQILEEKKQKLETGISDTEKESYWEEKIRQQGYVREGENPVVVIPPKETEKEESVKTQIFSGQILEKIKELFLKLIR